MSIKTQCLNIKPNKYIHNKRRENTRIKMMKKYTLTIYGQLTVHTENFDDINLNEYKISDLEKLIIENVEKEEK